MTRRSQELALCGSIEGRSCSFRLRPGANRVGRALGSEILLPTTGVSMCHALIIHGPEGLRVEDLASKNGTSVNGQPVGEAELSSGDEVCFGPVCLRLTEVSSLDSALALTLVDPEPVFRTEADLETPWVQPNSPLAVPALAFPDGYIVGRSLAMISLYRRLHAAANSKLPVLLLGETGAGKEYLARILHLSAAHRSGPFVGINCAAIPTDLLESELFGIASRAATGVAARPGKFRQAEGGTLFLDEIAEMSPDLQAKVLRVLQERVVDPVGAGSSLPVDVRIVASTNIELNLLVREKALREDLYYRLAGLVVEIAPLRRRREDIPALVEGFLVQATQGSGRSIRGITVRALDRLVVQPWPGNVRELANVIHQLVCLCLDGQAIDTDLVEEVLSSTSALEPPLRAAISPAPATPSRQATSQDLDVGSLARLDLEVAEKRFIKEAMRRAGGNKTRAAALLGISRDALRRRLSRHRLTDESS